MKKVITIACLIGSLVIILTSLDAGHALTMFLMIGLIPGTNIVIPPVVMLELVALIAGFTVARLLTPRLVRRAER